MRSESYERLTAQALATLEKTSASEMRALDRLLVAESAKFEEIARVFCEKGLVLAERPSGGRWVNPSTDTESVVSIFTYVVVGWCITGSTPPDVSSMRPQALFEKLSTLFPARA